MKRLTFSYRETSLVSDADIFKNQARLAPEIDRVSAVWGSGYDTDYASISLPSDRALHERVANCAREIMALKPAALVVIGIGGSNLGALAVYEALASVHAVFDLPVYWADTVDTQAIVRICTRVEEYLKKNQFVVVTIISKSGTTTETIANAQIIISLIEGYKKAETHKSIVVITDEGSKLHAVAQKNRYVCLPMPARVGGRYSVFSAAGLFPLAMLGVDIEQLCAGAQQVQQQCTNRDITKNFSATYAAILYELYQKNMRVHDLFLFDCGLRSMGMWYRQLMGESIGKAENREGKSVNVGIVPTISLGSTDLHSVGQLYLSGPRIVCTTFITVTPREILTIPFIAGLSELVPHVSGNSLGAIMHAIVHGTQRAYEKEKRPCMTIHLPEISAFACGQLMQSAMVQMMYLGFLFGINPFDQPQVELYKKETREILAHE